MYACVRGAVNAEFSSSRDILEMPSNRRASGRVRVSLNLKDECFARIQNANAKNSVKILWHADSCMCNRFRWMGDVSTRISCQMDGNEFVVCACLSAKFFACSASLDFCYYKKRSAFSMGRHSFQFNVEFNRFELN